MSRLSESVVSLLRPCWGPLVDFFFCFHGDWDENVLAEPCEGEALMSPMFWTQPQSSSRGGELGQAWPCSGHQMLVGGYWGRRCLAPSHSTATGTNPPAPKASTASELGAAEPLPSSGGLGRKSELEAGCCDHTNGQRCCLFSPAFGLQLKRRSYSPTH